MDDLKDKLFEIKVEHERYFYEIEEGPYYMQRAIVDAFKKALQETSRVVETVHPIYEHFNALNATSKEQMHNLVREFEKVAACYDEQIALVKGRNLEVCFVLWLRRFV
jgi:predicted choloylglycine hydrolase